MLGQPFLRFIFCTKSRVFVVLFLGFLATLPFSRNAWSDDLAPTATFSLPEACDELYSVIGYPLAEPGSLVLDPNRDDRLTDRIANAFAGESENPTAIKSTRDDLRPQSALVKSLIDPQKAAVAQILAIRNAKHSITIGTYIFGKDPYAYALLKEVKEALARGVDVHILVDSEGSASLFRHNLKVLHDLPRGNVVDDFGKPTARQATINTVVFNPVSRIGNLLPKVFAHLPNSHQNPEAAGKAFREVTARMHTKILGIDMDYPEGVAFIGGRNKDGDYYGYEKIGPRTYNDTEVMVRNDPEEFGPGQKTLSDTIGREFRKLYGHDTNVSLKGLFLGVKNPIYKKQIAKMDKAHALMWAPGGDYDKILKEMEAERFLETGYDKADVSLLSEIENIDRPDDWENVNQIGRDNLVSITKNLNHYAKYANKSITIVTPYPNLTDDEMNALIKQMLKFPDMKFTLMTNSLYSGDNIITQHVVDKMLIPKLKETAKAAALKAGQSEAEANAFVDRFKIYALGKNDGVEFGGKEFYGKLHAKYAIFESNDPSKSVTVVGSYNGDNISRNHNAEVAVALKGAANTTADFQAKTQQLIDKSYEWGSPDWQQIRDSKELKKKRMMEAALAKIIPLIYPIE